MPFTFMITARILACASIDCAIFFYCLTFPNATWNPTGGPMKTAVLFNWAIIRLSSLKGVISEIIYGNIIEVIKGDTRS